LLFIEKLLHRTFRNSNRLGVKRFYDANSIPVTLDLEENFDQIRAEYNRIIKRYDDLAPFQKISPHQTYISNDDRWKLFFLKGAGLWFQRNCREMPATANIIRKHAYVISAYISILGPRKKLNPHAGPYSGVLRLHLALDIPDPRKCYIDVGGERGYWEEGKCILFDDTYEHTATNNTDELRAVLFMDIAKPMSRHMMWLNWCIIKISRFFPYVFIPYFRHKRWEKEFYDL